MKVKGILLCLAFVVALSYSVNAEDYDHVTDLEVSGQPCVDETLTVTWTAFDQSHSATLRFNPGLFHPDSDVDRSAICPYVGEFGSAVFLDGELHKLYTSTSEHFEVERTHHFFNRRADTITADGDEDEWQRRERMLKTPGSHFVMTRTHSAQQDDARCGSDDIAHPAHTSLFSAQKKKTATARSQSYPSLPSAGGQLTYAGLTTTRYSDTPPSSCPQGTSYKAGSLAFVSDYSFYQIFNSLTTTQAEITALAQWVSVAFSNTLHVQLNLVLLSANVRTSLDSSSSTLNWNDGTCSSQTTSTILDRFTSWRASQTDYAVYHLLTKCWASGNVGLAWTGVVCTSGSPVNGNGPGLFSNTGVSSYLPGNGHLVSTHEIGHGFGAPHDDSVDSNGNGVGGIMTSCFCSTTAQPTLQEFSQLSQNAMASTCTKTCLTTGVNPGTSSTSSSSTTVATTVATAATTVTVAPGSSEQTQILAAVNNLRASYGVSSLTWSTAAANYAASGASACNWNALSSSSASYGVYWSASYPQATGTALSLAQSIVASKSAYTCSTDTCASSTWCSSAFRAFISSTTTGVACVSQACAAGTNSPWGTGVAWNLVACAASPYQVYSGQHPTGVTCPASKVVDEKCAAACGDRNCGTVKTDACGEVTCGQGDCDALGQCIDGYCACTPLTTCASRNVTCGRIVGNCGQRIVCNSGCDALGSKTSSSSASSSERDASSVQSESSCVAGTADLLCGQRVCGSVADGCGGTVTCGACRESSYCDDDSGACLVCDATCHPLGSCIRLQDGSTACQCPVGYSGDGVTCVQDAQPVPAQSCSAQSWTSAFGSAAGFFFAPAVSVTKNVAACNIAHEDTGSSDGLLFSDWTYSVDGGDAFWSVAITRQSGDVGLIGQSVVDNDSKATVFSLRYEAGHQALYFTVHGRYGYSKRLKSFAWPAGDTHVLTAVFRSSGTIVATLDDELLEGFEVSYLSSAQFGIVASGNALFTAAEISLASAVQLTVSGCWTEDAIVSYLAQALYIDPSLISATVTCIDGSSDVTIYIDSGSSSVSALGAAAMLKQKSNVRGVVVAANPAAITGRLSAVMKTGAVVQGTANGVTPVYYAQAPLTAATAGGSGGLSGGAIAGIVIGSVAGAALILGGGAYLIARNKRHEDHDTDLGAAQEQPRPKSWRQSIARINPLKKNRGVNVMEHDPTKHMSITGRNPNISQ